MSIRGSYPCKYLACYLPKPGGGQNVLRMVHFVAMVFLAIATTITGASAAAGPWQTSQQSDARLISATNGVGTSATLAIGVELKLRDGWKTYWRSPGDAGLPPSVDWSGSENFKSATLGYPAPHRFEVLGLQTVGYSHDVIFPIMVELKAAGQPFAGKAQLNVLVCEKICIPQTFNLDISVPAGPALASDEAQGINRAQSAVPGDGRAAGLTLQSVKAMTRPSGADALQVIATSRDRFQQPDLFAELKSELAFGRPEVTLSADGSTATFTLSLSKPLPPGATLVGQSAVLTLVDGARSAEFPAEIAIGSGRGTSDSGGIWSLVQVVGIALLGGLILNVMPCVLPILSIKVVSFAKETGRNAYETRMGMIATAIGIVASMLLIAGVLIALKSAGVAIGWGIQFQQPLFIAAMALLLTLFACNFWDFFEVSLPGAVSNFAATRGGDGQSLVGNFLIGAFATLLATPCSAPFVGTAVGFALGQGPLEIAAIFAALGLGLASPYLAVAAMPSVVRFMPRPGPWMIGLRRVMGLALVLTAAWLLTVLAGQIGWQHSGLMALLLAALTVCLALAKFVQPLRGAMISGAALLALSTLASGFLVERTSAHDSEGSRERIAWEPLKQDRIKSLVAQGKTVFVDVTADWCLTCKANKRFVLEQLPLVDRLTKDTIPMRGDWTSPDPKITQFLGSYGKYGVPFNIVFGPGSPTGIALPELLTTEAVSAAIDKAAVAPATQPQDTRG